MLEFYTFIEFQLKGVTFHFKGLIVTVLCIECFSTMKMILLNMSDGWKFERVIYSFFFFFLSKQDITAVLHRIFANKKLIGF